MRRIVVLAGLAVAIAGCGDDDGPTPSERPHTAVPARTVPAAAAETGDRAVEHLEALMALTARAGGDRAAGTDGERAAADYATRVLRAAGYVVRREQVRFPFYDERSPARVVLAGERLGSRRTVRTLASSPGGEVSGRLAPVALDRVASGCRAGDFAQVGEGEVALVGRGVCPFFEKVARAARAGAAAVIVVDRDNDEAPRGTLGEPGARERVPAVVVGRRVGERLRAGLPSRARVRLRTDTVAERRVSPNVVAEAPGGPAQVMVGGHLDSVPDVPGANDNASGVAATLAAAERLARDGVAVRVGLWGAEELGLHGSRRHVRSLDAGDRRRLRAYVNLDMVGSPNRVAVFYGQGPQAGAQRLRRVLRAALRRQGERPERSGMRGGSDHAPFARAGIPAGGLFTGAAGRRDGRPADPCYHRRCDDADNVDRTALRRNARAAVDALRRLAP